MGIPEWIAETREVQLPGGSHFTVRGLGVGDIASLLRLHLEDMEEVRSLVMERMGAEISEKSIADLGLQVITRLPLVAATVIALAADDLEATERVTRFPLHIQFAALKHVAELTFQDVAGLKLMLTTATMTVSAALPLVAPSST